MAGLGPALRPASFPQTTRTEMVLPEENWGAILLQKKEEEDTGHAKINRCPQHLVRQHTIYVTS